MRQKLVSFQLSGIEVRRKKIKINLDEDFFLLLCDPQKIVWKFMQIVKCIYWRINKAKNIQRDFYVGASHVVGN